jgi:hypothetical protein
MLKRAMTALFVVAAIAFSSAAAEAQYVVHALGGTVQSEQAAKKTMVLSTDDGSPGRFQFPQTASVNVTFDKDVRSETVGTDKFNGEGHHVIVFYFGDDEVRTAFAVEDLGTGPLVKAVGTVVSMDKYHHTITLATAPGVQQTFGFGEKTVVDTAAGVTTGKKFSANKGDHLRLLAASKDGQQQAMLIRTSGVDSAM